MNLIISKVAREMACEIYNPVTLIKGYADLLAKRLKDGASSQESLSAIIKEIQDNCKRATDIAECLQDLSIRELPEKLVFCSTPDIVERSLQLFSEKTKKLGVKLQVQHEQPELKFWCHHLQVVQILTCLFDQVLERVQNKTVRGIAIVSFLKKSEEGQSSIVIRIQDTGSPRSQLPRVNFCDQILQQIGGELELMESPFGACLELRFKIKII